MLVQLWSNLSLAAALAPLAVSTGLYDMTSTSQAAAPSPVRHIWILRTVRSSTASGREGRKARWAA
ncbi:hypothetical protein [Streptomyces sp. MH60]|uniref:hypothetical protein n=1 Tax=Streptomyces sp. MH60 TaxID=1940758 RepID=UPI001F546E08|nr:hypothetical protein [Streptomyces sp. MH60]